MITQHDTTLAAVRWGLAVGLVMGGELALAPRAAADTLFALVDTGQLFDSVDGGRAWQVRAALPASDAVGLCAGSSPTELFLLTRSGLVHTSGDAGVRWTTTGAIPASDLVGMTLLPDGTLVALSSSGLLWRSEDGGFTFAVASALPASDHVALARDERAGLHVVTATGMVQSSDDGGFTWQLETALPVPDAVALHEFDDHLLVLTDTGQVWMGGSGPHSWSAIGTLSQVRTRALVTDQANDLYAATEEGYVARSGDGVTWSWVGVTGQLRLTALASDRPLLSAPGSGSEASMGVASVGAPFPNPVGPSARGLELTVRGVNGSHLGVRLFDVSGRELVRSRWQVVSETIEATHLRVQTDELAPGVYFVDIRQDGQSLGSRRFAVTP